jgi:hypothetical protein
MLLWDLKTDRVTGGQWLAGRVYEEKCGLSPDGKLLVYFAGKFNTKLGTFTAVSRPPYFTALALWPDGSTWGGGGFFEGNRKLILRYGLVIDELHQNRTIPADFKISHETEYRGRHAGAETPESNQGWTLTSRGTDGEPTEQMRVVFATPWISEKPSPVRAGLKLERLWLGMFEMNGPSSVNSYRLVRTDQTRGVPKVEDLGRLDFADWDRDGSLLFGEHGCLFRRSMLERGGRTSAAEQVADLRDQVFTYIRPPDDASSWPV